MPTTANPAPLPGAAAHAGPSFGGDKTRMSFAFGPFVLKPGRQLLTKYGAPVRIGGRSLDILTVLVERPGEVISKRELVSRVWPQTFVEESNLKTHVVAIRRILDDNPATPRYIATVTGRGYRFIFPVEYYEASREEDGLGGPLPS